MHISTKVHDECPPLKKQCASSTYAYPDSTVLGLIVLYVSPIDLVRAYRRSVISSKNCDVAGAVHENSSFSVLLRPG
jgi:hypothetical protein